MSEQTIFYQIGTTKSIDALLKHLKITNDSKCWSWYEPKPESLIGIGIKLPLCTLKKGKPDIEGAIQFSECMLFYPNAGITLVAKNQAQLDYFYWTENAIDNATGSMQTRKETKDAYLRNKDILKDQFNIPKDCYPDLEEIKKLQMIKYYDDNQCIAWTIAGGK